MTMFCFVIVTFLLFIHGSSGISCPSGFETHADNCYLFSHGKDNWVGAFESCKLFNAHLVEVNDRAENAFLSNKVAAHGNYFWIGLTDKLLEGEYVWETSMKQLMPGDFTYWGGSEPNGKDNENCVFYAREIHSMWGDGDCMAGRHYICEINGEGAEVIG